MISCYTFSIDYWLIISSIYFVVDYINDDVDVNYVNYDDDDYVDSNDSYGAAFCRVVSHSRDDD